MLRAEVGMRARCANKASAGCIMRGRGIGQNSRKNCRYYIYYYIYYRRVLYRAWWLTAYRGWARLMLDRRSLVQAPKAPRDQSQHPRARNDYDEEIAYESYMNPEPGFQSGPGDSVDAD